MSTPPGKGASKFPNNLHRYNDVYTDITLLHINWKLSQHYKARVWFAILGITIKVTNWPRVLGLWSQIIISPSLIQRESIIAEILVNLIHNLIIYVSNYNRWIIWNKRDSRFTHVSSYVKGILRDLQVEGVFSLWSNPRCLHFCIVYIRTYNCKD